MAMRPYIRFSQSVPLREDERAVKGNSYWKDLVWSQSAD
jgi:hypothetical protein